MPNIQKSDFRIVATNKTIHSIVEQEIARYGNEADLNHIDVSQVADMRTIFADSRFNGDISRWNVSNVETMEYMFRNSDFNGDISEWDVSSVKDMNWMFRESKFNGNISNWDVSNVENMANMFRRSSFNGNISEWDVSNVEVMKYMFSDSKFNGDVSQWNVRDDCDMAYALTDSPALTHQDFGKMHFMTKADDESIVLHPDAEAAYAASMLVTKSMHPKPTVQGAMAWEAYQASQSQVSTDSYDYTAALDACEEFSSAEAERAR